MAGQGYLKDQMTPGIKEYKAGTPASVPPGGGIDPSVLSEELGERAPN